MPTITIDLFTGRTPQQKRDLARLLTEATVEALSVEPEKVRVKINEVHPHHSAVGGRLAADPPEAG